MDVFWFHDLARLAQTGNFSQAAELSNLSQPALSRRIKALEAWVGVDLVDRKRQPVRLTDAGLQMLEAGQQALARLEQERSQILESRSLPDRYVITFGAQHSIGWRFYPAWLQAFEEVFGPILSRLRADDLPNCLADLKTGDVDFVIAYDHPQTRASEPGAQPSLVIGTDSLVPVCKPAPDGQPLFDFAPGRAAVPFLRFGQDAPIAAHMEPLFAAQNLTPRLQTVYENAMAGALRIRARDGAGVAWLPRSLVAPDLASNLLVRTGAPDWEVPLEIRIHRNTDHSNRLTRAIWSFLEVRQSVPLVSAD